MVELLHPEDNLDSVIELCETALHQEIALTLNMIPHGLMEGTTRQQIFLIIRNDIHGGAHLRELPPEMTGLMLWIPKDGRDLENSTARHMKDFLIASKGEISMMGMVIIKENMIIDMKLSSHMTGMVL